MAKDSNRSGDQAAAILKLFASLPNAAKIGIVFLLLIGGVGYLIFSKRNPTAETPSKAGDNVPSGTIVFMFWNVENLFDDHDDKRNSIDNPYDDWFATDSVARKMKYDHLADIILMQNAGRGPDIFACCEVESIRAAMLLRDALNAKLPPGTARYDHIAMKELASNAGRFMAPCIISRLAIDVDRTQLLGQHNLRVLQTYVVVNGYDLCLVASHWTSQLSDDGTKKGSGRDKYATTIADDYAKLMKDTPDADYLLCGDFNTTPDSDVVTEQLHMTSKRAEVIPRRTEPKLFGLLSGKPVEKYGTLYYNGPVIYDQIGVSAGMLDDKGWSCDTDSVTVPVEGLIRENSRTRRPWRFGSKDDNAEGRGYSDHFPVVVHLKLAGKPQ